MPQSDNHYLIAEWLSKNTPSVTSKFDEPFPIFSSKRVSLSQETEGDSIWAFKKSRGKK